jgi:hypothetical protein
MDRNEKRFEIGQRVRIIGPTAADTNIHTGKCFVIEEAKGVLWKNGPFQYCMGYSKHGSIHAWPASSLELAEPEYVTDEPPTAHRLAALQYQCQKNDSKIDELESRAVGRFNDIEKRLQALEDKAKEDTGRVDRESLPDAHLKISYTLHEIPIEEIFKMLDESTQRRILGLMGLRR